MSRTSREILAGGVRHDGDWKLEWVDLFLFLFLFFVEFGLIKGRVRR